MALPQVALHTVQQGVRTVNTTHLRSSCAICNTITGTVINHPYNSTGACMKYQSMGEPVKPGISYHSWADWQQQVLLRRIWSRERDCCRPARPEQSVADLSAGQPWALRSSRSPTSGVVGVAVVEKPPEAVKQCDQIVRNRRKF